MKLPWTGVIHRRHVDSREVALKGARDARAELAGVRQECAWRRRVMGDAKDELAAGNPQGAWLALTRHEREGYPWAPGVRGDRGPDAAREAM